MTPQTKRRQEIRVSVSGPVKMQTVRGGTRHLFSLSVRESN